jgi:hypothetical protein
MAQTQMFTDPFWFSDNHDIELNQFHGQAGPWNHTPDDTPLRPALQGSKWSEDSSRVAQPAWRFRSPSNMLPRLALQLPRFSQRQKAEIQQRRQQQQQQQQPPPLPPTPRDGTQTPGNRISADRPPERPGTARDGPQTQANGVSVEVLRERPGTPRPRNEAETVRNGSDVPRERAEIPEPLSPAPRTYIAVHRHRTLTGRILHRYSPRHGGQETPPPWRRNPFSRRDRSREQDQERDDASAWREVVAFIVICMSHFCARKSEIWSRSITGFSNCTNREQMLRLARRYRSSSLLPFTSKYLMSQASVGR